MWMCFTMFINWFMFTVVKLSMHWEISLACRQVGKFWDSIESSSDERHFCRGSKKIEMDKASFQFNFFKSEESEMESEASSGISESKELKSFEWIVPVETIEKIKTTADLESEQVLCLLKKKYSSILHDLKGSSESELTKITEILMSFRINTKADLKLGNVPLIFYTFNWRTWTCSKSSFGNWLWEVVYRNILL